MKFIGNIIWLVFGGILISILYLIGSLLLIITIYWNSIRITNT